MPKVHMIFPGSPGRGKIMAAKCMEGKVKFYTGPLSNKSNVFLLFSSNINEVVKSVLNFLIFFTKRFHQYKKAQNRLQRTKIENVYKKHLSSNINEVIKAI